MNNSNGNGKTISVWDNLTRIVNVYLCPKNTQKIKRIHTTVINSGRAHTTQLRTHCGL